MNIPVDPIGSGARNALRKLPEKVNWRRLCKRGILTALCEAGLAESGRGPSNLDP